MRQSGRTTEQMIGAKHGAVYVWCNDYLVYPKSLAKSICREDLNIVPPRVFEKDFGYFRGKKLSGLVLDHALDLDRRHREGFEYALHMVVGGLDK